MASRDDDPGVPLAHYRRPGAGVRFRCRDCLDHRDVDLETVIAGLKARGDGDERTGIRAVAQVARKPCQRCGGTRFETTPAMPPRRVSV